MQFISTMKQQSYTFQPARKEVIKTNVGNVVQAFLSKRIQFEPLALPFHTPTLSAKNGMAWGVLDSKHAAKKARISEKDLIEFLMAHPHYGIRMVGIGHDGSEVLSDETHIVREGEKGFYCEICEKHLQNMQGMKNHVKSAAHKELFEAARLEVMEGITS